MNNIYKATQLIGDTYAKQMIGENEYIQSWHVHKLKHTFAVASNIMDLLFSEKEIFESFSASEIELALSDEVKNNPDFNNPILLFAIEEHNQFAINFENPYYKNLSDHDKKVAEIIAKLLRDADKLENIKHFIYYGISELHFNTPNTPLSDKVKEAITSGKQINSKFTNGKADKIVNSLSWVYDIYFESTKEQIRNLKYIDFGIKEAKKYGATDEDCELLRKNLKV